MNQIKDNSAELLNDGCNLHSELKTITLKQIKIYNYPLKSATNLKADSILLDHKTVDAFADEDKERLFSTLKGIGQ